MYIINKYNLSNGNDVKKLGITAFSDDICRLGSNVAFELNFRACALTVGL